MVISGTTGRTTEYGMWKTQLQQLQTQKSLFYFNDVAMRKGFTEIKCNCEACGTLQDNQVIRLLPNPVWEYGSSVHAADNKPTLLITLGSYVIHQAALLI